MTTELPVDPATEPARKTRWRAFWDFFVLFSGISTASNLSRAQGRKVRNRGLFLFRKTPEEQRSGPDRPQ
jgi:hypothetical protein